jgi:NAD(P)-dependent dehydrogenase (short-subunit alcohol dehydrogenase family)
MLYADVVTIPDRTEDITTTSLVTGGAGFLARTCATNLIRRGHRVICVDNLETGSSLGNIEHLRDPAVVYHGYDIVAEQGYSAAEIAAQLGHADRGVTALRWYVCSQRAGASIKDLTVTDDDEYRRVSVRVRTHRIATLSRELEGVDDLPEVASLEFERARGGQA